MTNPIRVMMVDDEPLIRKLVKLEMDSRSLQIESGNENGSVMRPVVMDGTFADGPSFTAALASLTPPDYLLVDMEFRGEPTGGLSLTRRVHERWPDVRIIIFSGRFDNPQPHSSTDSQPQRLLRMVEIGHVVMEALSLGASAFVSKNATGGFSVENILRAIECLERGERFYFNYPVMLTLKEAAERYLRLVQPGAASLSLSATEHELLLLEAAGYTAAEISTRLGESDKAIQEHQRDLSRRLGIVNKSASRVAKSFALGLIDPAEIKFLEGK